MFAQTKLLEFPQSPAGTVIVGLSPVFVGNWWEKGYDYTRDGGAGFTAALEGSVGNGQWTSLLNLNVSAQGALAVHYNWFRINVSVGGALGATTRLIIAGKE
jgi:hypothetical protein